MNFCDCRDYPAMSDPQHDIRVWMQDNLARLPHGAKGRLAKHLGVRPDAITRMANTDPGKETREIRAHEHTLMIDFFSAEIPHDEADETTESIVPIMGYLGAGSEIEPDYEQVPPEGLDEVTIPFPVPADLIGFKVRGTSMLPVYRDGTVVLVYREQKRALHTFFGEDAAVLTSLGRRFIKTVMRGQGNTVTLTSWNADPIEDQRLEWIGEIFAVLPPSALRRVDRQGGIQGQLRLKRA